MARLIWISVVVALAPLLPGGVADSWEGMSPTEDWTNVVGSVEATATCYLEGYPSTEDKLMSCWGEPNMKLSGHSLWYDIVWESACSSIPEACSFGVVGTHRETCETHMGVAVPTSFTSSGWVIWGFDGGQDGYVQLSPAAAAWYLGQVPETRVVVDLPRDMAAHYINQSYSLSGTQTTVTVSTSNSFVHFHEGWDALGGGGSFKPWTLNFQNEPVTTMSIQDIEPLERACALPADVSIQVEVEGAFGYASVPTFW